MTYPIRSFLSALTILLLIACESSNGNTPDNIGNPSDGGRTEEQPDGDGEAAGEASEEEIYQAGRSTCELIGPVPEEPAETILFGDLHSHSDNSLDAVAINLPILDGRAHGPTDNCNFARYCAQLDFWSLIDHAEEQLAYHWEENIEAIRSCNNRFGGYTHEPDLISYLGWEWTQSADTPEEDFGHHNVVLKHTCTEEIPLRPFASPTSFAGIDTEMIGLYADLVSDADPDNEDLYRSFYDWVVAFTEKPMCDPDTDTLYLPHDCHEVALSTAELYHLFDRWDIEALAIPHGTVWGSHHPQLTSWSTFFSDQYRSLTYSPVVEIYSGHGNSEEYRAWRHAEKDADGNLVCPDPTDDFEPCCWRAGEIIRSRDEDCQADPQGDACREAVEQAKADYLAMGKKGLKSIKNAGADDWLDCGQCRDCFQSALSPRPERSVQAALAMSNFDDPDNPWRYIFGMIGSTDSHRAGPGAGYREYWRMADCYGPASEEVEFLVKQAASFISPDIERRNSFDYAGGLVAVHSQGRSRNAVWEALINRRVYATSGERIELWFDLVNAPEEGTKMMGSVVTMAETPSFEVRAVGSYKQNPGCPEWVVDEMGSDFVETMCFGECYNPTDERYRIMRIEVVKVTPQISEDEELAPLIQDPFLVLPCGEEGRTQCRVTFEDEEYLAGSRPASYYVRAIMEPTLQVNADTLRCERDTEGNCIRMNVCDSSYTGEDDDCLAMDEERAWSSPIFLYPE